MRLLERTLRDLYIAPGLTGSDDLGAVTRVFSEERIPVRASVIPGEGGMAQGQAGVTLEQRCTALMPLDAPIAPGDGVSEKPDGAPEWLVADVRRWAAHLAATLVRRTWP